MIYRNSFFVLPTLTWTLPDISSFERCSIRRPSATGTASFLSIPFECSSQFPFNPVVFILKILWWRNCQSIKVGLLFPESVTQLKKRVISFTPVCALFAKMKSLKNTELKPKPGVLRISFFMCNQGRETSPAKFQESRPFTVTLANKPNIFFVLNNRMQHFELLNDLIFQLVVKPVLFNFSQCIFIIYKGFAKMPVIFIFKPFNK